VPHLFVHEFRALTLPDTLQAATNITASTSQQLTLKLPARRIGPFRVLQAIHPIETDKPSLLDYMDTLTRLSLTMIESEAPDLAYIFKHAVTQEVAYNLMLFSQRRQLHQAVAEWIEESNQQNIQPFYPLLAHHWAQAAETPDAVRNAHAIRKAVEYLEKAGEQAMENYANAEAIQFFDQALECEAKLPKSESKPALRNQQIRRARWHSRAGLAHYGIGSLPDCEKHVRAALRILGSPIPTTRAQFAFGLFPQIVRQVFHRYFPARYIGSLKGSEREVAIEASRLYELMGRFYFYSQETLPIMYCILRFMNTAEKAGPSPELATSYAGMAVLAGLAQLHPLAETCGAGAGGCKQVNQPSNLVTECTRYRSQSEKWDECAAAE
jgi:hypothetical protein